LNHQDFTRNQAYFDFSNYFENGQFSRSGPKQFRGRLWQYSVGKKMNEYTLVKLLNPFFKQHRLKVKFLLIKLHIPAG
jgi:hypothetical protein